MHIETLIQRARPQGGDIKPDIESRELTIDLKGINDEHPIWADLSDVLRRDGFFSAWHFIADGKEIHVLPKMVDEVAKNQEKNNGKAINASDITDLKISLANAQSIDDILKAMEG